MIDLHTHSACSDGTDPPAAVVELAAAAGCHALALTDHDTVAGLPEAQTRADELGVRLVRACEMSCAFRGASAHVLVYFVDREESPLHEELAQLRLDRIERNRRLVGRLQELGLGLTYEEVVGEAAGEESVGRPHVAAVLVRHGAAENIDDAFDRWLAAGRPAHVPRARLPLDEAARLARLSGAVPVLAHPLSLRLEAEELAQLTAELAEVGFCGLEAFYGRYSPAQRADLADLAQRHGLVATGGSDYHGTVKKDLSVGRGRGDLHVPIRVLAALEARRAA